MNEIADKFPWIVFLESALPAFMYNGTPFCANPYTGFVLNNLGMSKLVGTKIEQCERNVFEKGFHKCCWTCGQGKFGAEKLWRTLAEQYAYIHCIL